MVYHWNPAEMTAPIVLPAMSPQALVDATAEQWRVLVWLSSHRLEWDAVACAADCALTEAACEACLQYWLTQGTIMLATDAPAPAPKTKLARPQAVKPQLREVLAYQKANPHFNEFLEAASALLGKPIGHQDSSTLLYLLDTVGLPEDVIYTEIGYAVHIGKPNMRYIEKIALDWADKDLVTYQAVEEHIRELENERVAAERVEKLLSLTRPLTATQAKMADKWLNLWNFSEEMLQRAAEITVEKTGKFTAAYMDRVLERWHAEGIDTVSKIPAAVPPKKRGAAATNPETSSLDTMSLDAQLLRYTPKL